jgi:predicted secreted protein
MDRRASYAGKPVAFTPSMISGLRADWDGDINYGGAGGTWSDRSGIGNHLTCTGTTAGAGKNGKGTVLFNGVDDVATKASLSLGSPTGITIAMACKLVATAANSTFFSLDTTEHLLLTLANNGVTQYASHLTTSTSATADIAAAWKRLIVTDDGVTGMQLYLNGVATGAAAVPTTTIATAKAFSLGAILTTVNPGNIEYARVLVWNRPQTASELFLTDSYLGRTYAI